MAYLQDTVALQAGAPGAEILFAVPFNAAPGIVIPVVRNISDDNPKVQVTATLDTVTPSGFTVVFDTAIPNDHYELCWIAGSAEMLFNVVTSLTGRAHTGLPARNLAPASGDLLLITRMAPVPTTEALRFSVLQDLFVSRVAPPAGSHAPGALGQWAVSAGGMLYVHTGISWGRLQLQLNW